jgi:uroporphyrin-III C-methyltransferase/precorrin-2 dehydrogenase/sirohydrochlorin ferrochelatase
MAADYDLIFAATDDRAVNRQVYEDARSAGVWVNVADDPPLCTFQLPARVRRGDLQIAISSAGEAPFVVRRLRQLLEKRFGPEWAEWLDAAARFRRGLREQARTAAAEELCFDHFFSQTVDIHDLTARVPLAEEETRWLEQGCNKPPKSPDARENGACYHSPPLRSTGLVSLVGAGPGDPRLLTLRAQARLFEADVVVYDRLAATALPCDLPATTELHCVGKRVHRHPVPQTEINAMLVRLALAGKRVVRLKGGDPFVFGRGGEEAMELVAAGIPFEIVPSVTAGVAVPAYAGIPVTNRGEAVRLTLITAHEAVKSDGPQIRWDLLAADPHATLVGYMGVNAIARVQKQLLAAGMDPAMPAAMIERGTTSRQRIVRASLAELPKAVRDACISPPALFVVGPTVRHTERLDWFSRRPLHGARILLPKSNQKLAAALEPEGAEIVTVPIPLTPAARIVVAAAPLTDCVLGCVEDVEALDEERDAPGWEQGFTAWCLGHAVAQRARSLGWLNIEEIPSDECHCGQELVAALHARL